MRSVLPKLIVPVLLLSPASTLSVVVMDGGNRRAQGASQGPEGR